VSSKPIQVCVHSACELAAIYLCRKLAGLPVRQIAEEFAVKSARVSNAVIEVEPRPERAALRRRIQRLQQQPR